MRNKKILLMIAGVVLAAVLIGILLIGMRAVPTVNHALRISELLKPVLDAQNQTMHMAVSAQINATPLELESDVFLVTEDDAEFLALEQGRNTVFVSGNVLFLENGKAFRIGEEMQSQLKTYQDLLPQIGMLYDVLKISAEETETETVYSVTVTGDQVKTLLEVISLPVEGIDKLNLQLTEKNGKLEQIRFSGNGVLDGTDVALNVTISGFRILAAGDYPIPEAVTQCAATVDPEGLFSLTEDLYRLALALVPFGDMESIDGTLELSVDCGPIQLDTKLQLSDLQTSSGAIDPGKLQELPEMVGWLCMEADIRCTPDGDAYVYTLELDPPAMGELARMILPELQQYSGNLTEGNAAVIVEDGKIHAMEISIKGKIRALIMQIPITVGAEFTFDG